MSEKVFVYGTLRKGKPLNVHLRNAAFLGDAKTAFPAFRMFCTGWYPAVIEAADDAYELIGEVYEVDEKTMHGLDAAEGVPSLYQRKQVDVVVGDETHKVWIYIYQPPVNNFREVTSGDYYVQNSDS